MDNFTSSQRSTTETINQAADSFVNILAKAIANQVASQLANQVAPLLYIEKSQPQDRLLNIDEACELLQLEKPTVYSKVSRGELPHIKKAKRLYFSRQSLLDYIHSGRVKTNEELQNSALDYLNIKRR